MNQFVVISLLSLSVAFSSALASPAGLFCPSIFTSRDGQSQIAEAAHTNNLKLKTVIESTEPKTHLIMGTTSSEESVMKSIVGIRDYEERYLVNVLEKLISNPRDRVIFVSTYKVWDIQLDHLINSLLTRTSQKQNIPSKADILARLTLLNFDEFHPGYLQNNPDSPLSLSRLLQQKFIANGQTSPLLERLRLELKKTKNLGFLSAFYISEGEEALAEHLSIPIYGTLADLSHFLNSKSEQKRVFDEAKISHASYVADIYNRGQLVGAIKTLATQFPHAKKLVLKTNQGVSGKGNAILHLSKISTLHPAQLWHELTQKSGVLNPQNHDWSAERFLEEMFAGGGIAEVWISTQNENQFKTSPSIQFFINYNGQIEILSTHEQILSEDNIYLGAESPAHSLYRTQLVNEGLKVAQVLRDRGVRGTFALDALALLESPDGSIDNAKLVEFSLIEANIRQGGTTHPLRTAQHIAGAKTFTENANSAHYGVFVNEAGQPVFYQASDNLIIPVSSAAEAYTFIKEKLFQLEAKQLLYNWETGTGGVFHMLANSQNGKVGITVFGNTRDEANRIFNEIENLLSQ